MADEQFPVHYSTARVKEIDIFYREAGPQNAPGILLLHGFPTSSNMFRNLIPRLAASFHVIAPDFPGFGQSSMPDRETFAYTFENLTSVVEQLTEQLGLGKYSLYVMDYRAPSVTASRCAIPSASRRSSCRTATHTPRA